MFHHRAMTYWRKAATLLLAVPRDATVKPSVELSYNDHQRPIDCEDYKLLMLKRNQSSSFFPSSFVFPGGTLSPIDSSCDWKPLFEHVTGERIDDIAKYFNVKTGPRPPIITESIDERSNNISADIAFRICAIRETFEECGVLLVTNRKSSLSYWSDVDLQMWQRRVSQNASEFLVLCQQLSVVPNVWLLYEWSNWMTPVMNKVQGPSARPKRFDTLFYICFMHESVLPEVTLDNEEIVDHVWTSPSLYVRNHAGISPQIYEMGRLSRFDKLAELQLFVKERQHLGMERLMSVRVLCRDAVLLVLPGDELYPDNPDFCGNQPTDMNMTFMEKSYVELCAESQVMHRYVLTQDGTKLLLSNCRPLCGHVRPVSDRAPSKL